VSRGILSEQQFSIRKGCGLLRWWGRGGCLRDGRVRGCCWSEKGEGEEAGIEGEEGLSEVDSKRNGLGDEKGAEVDRV